MKQLTGLGTLTLCGTMGFEYLFFALIASQVVTETWAARRVDAHAVARETMKKRRSQEDLIQRRDEAQLDTATLLALSPGESLEPVLEATDARGATIERLEERYQGLKVYDTVVTVRKAADGQLTGDATGTLIQNIDEDLPDVKAKLTDDEILDIALKIEKDDRDRITGFSSETEVFVDKTNRARLVSIMSYLVDGDKRPTYIIDANNGEVLEHWDGLTTYPCCTRNYKAWGGNEKMGKITYGDMPHCITPTIVDGSCILENDYVRVVDMLQTFQENITESASFECEKGYGDEVNGAYSPATDAFFYGTVVGKMFEEWFESTALYSKVVLRVHYGYMYQNAFWNGVNTTFGDGGSYFYPLTSLDVVSHEVAHGVTEQGSGLEYRGDSGGMNEAFSDMMGEAAEDYLLDSDFMTGQTIMKTLPYLREFETPENDNRSISKVEDMTEWTDPHYSSGVYRRVWWVVIKEGGVSIRDAATVFLYANRMYWHSTSSFYDGSCGTLKAAMDLGFDTAPYRKAFQDVGLEDCDVKTHVFGLNNNSTHKGIVVSETINPVFKLETPEWADTLIVDATPNEVMHDVVYDAEVKITIMTNGWEFSDDECESAVLVAEGINHVEVPNAADEEYFIKLSLSDDTVIPSDSNSTFSYIVDLTAGYTCIENYHTDYYASWRYYKDCGVDYSY